MRNTTTVALALGLALPLTLTYQAPAALITFEHHLTGSITGTIGGVPFSTTNIVLTGIGDNDNRESYDHGFSLDHDSASIEILGVGTFDFITGTRTFVNNAFAIVGWSREGTGGIDLTDGPVNAVFGAWDMLTSIGPVTGVGFIGSWTFGDILTTGGILELDDTVDVGITFTASKVPGPSTLAVFAVVGLVGGRRRRTKGSSSPAPASPVFLRRSCLGW